VLSLIGDPLCSRPEDVIRYDCSEIEVFPLICNGSSGDFVS
jgi:hypothetical protein